MLRRTCCMDFNGLEDNNQWRWVAGKFGVTLAEPEGAVQKGARLELKFAYPEAAFSKLGPLTLSASVNGQPLLPETYKAQGPVYVYSRHRGQHVSWGSGDGGVRDGQSAAAGRGGCAGVEFDRDRGESQRTIVSRFSRE